MRELKFRVWLKSVRKFVTEYRFSPHMGDAGKLFLGLNGKLHLALYPCGNGDNAADSVFEPMTNQDGFVIQQFTGVKDVDGQDIYEGDILKGTAKTLMEIFGEMPELQAGEVKWFREGWEIHQLKTGYTSSARLSDYIQCDCHPVQLKVIGNVFENANLLSE